ncbi:ABC transporter permease [Winogradskyella sp.]|uniref:ABC transporter permease n=1 Tax=Winogradskyella sp. TaxID=1883156 RepID=UPI003BAD5350
MIKNYFKIAWRNLTKHKTYTLINLSGLTLGMTCVVLIAIYVHFEFSYDKHNENIDRIFRIVEQEENDESGETEFYPLSPLPLTTALVNDIPEIEAITNLDLRETLLVNGENSYSENGLFTDSNIFEVFTIDLLHGQYDQVLNDPTSIILTESLALKMFNKTEVVGETILLANKVAMTIKGIVADPPKNQHFHYDFICPSKIRPQFKQDLLDWASNNYTAYMLLREGYDYKAVEDKMVAYEAITKEVYQNMDLPFYPKFSLQPVKDIHLYSNMYDELEENGSINYIYFFLLLAFIILFLASVNYINLATAKSRSRSKEVGVLRTMGANRQNIVFQYLSESIVLSVFGALVALVLSFVLLPYFSELLNKELPFELFFSPYFLFGTFCFALLIACLSGLFPSLLLSRLSPVKALKGHFVKVSNGQINFRNVLVVIQFVFAIALVAGSIIIYQQIAFFQDKELGYKKENMLHVNYSSSVVAKNEEIIKEALLTHPNIKNVSISSHLPMEMKSNGLVDHWEGNTNNDQVNLYRTFVDYDFIDLFDIEIIEGRGFSRDFYSDSLGAYVLNESAVKKLGWTTAVGKRFNRGVVVGVAKDFHAQPLHMRIEPLYMKLRTSFPNKRRGEIVLSIENIELHEIKDFVMHTLKSISPIDIFELKVLENTYDELYGQERRLGQAFNVFAFIAMFLAGLGLFGLVSFQVFERTKEIGIRKVLGSSVYNVVILLSRTFLSLLLVSFLIATPLGYYLMDKWLQNYAYHINLDGWTFVIAGMFTILIAFLTVSVQAIKAATANPVKSLRAE